MGLRYATVTGFARDDLANGGTWLHAGTVRQICASALEVYAHNLETVPRLFKSIRPAFRYERSLGVVPRGRGQGMSTKSNLILGMGETRAEVSEALASIESSGTTRQEAASLIPAP